MVKAIPLSQKINDVLTKIQTQKGVDTANTVRAELNKTTDLEEQWEMVLDAAESLKLVIAEPMSWNKFSKKWMKQRGWVSKRTPRTPEEEEEDSKPLPPESAEDRAKRFQEKIKRRNPGASGEYVYSGRSTAARLQDPNFRAALLARLTGEPQIEPTIQPESETASRIEPPKVQQNMAAAPLLPTGHKRTRELTVLDRMDRSLRQITVLLTHNNQKIDKQIKHQNAASDALPRTLGRLLGGRNSMFGGGSLIGSLLGLGGFMGGGMMRGLKGRILIPLLSALGVGGLMGGPEGNIFGDLYRGLTPQSVQDGVSTANEKGEQFLGKENMATLKKWLIPLIGGAGAARLFGIRPTQVLGGLASTMALRSGGLSKLLGSLVGQGGMISKGFRLAGLTGIGTGLYNYFNQESEPKAPPTVAAPTGEEVKPSAPKEGSLFNMSAMEFGPILAAALAGPMLAAIKGAVMLNPLVFTAAAVTIAAGSAIYMNQDSIKGLFNDIVDNFKSHMGMNVPREHTENVLGKIKEQQEQGIPEAREREKGIIENADAAIAKLEEEIRLHGDTDGHRAKRLNNWKLAKARAEQGLDQVAADMVNLEQQRRDRIADFNNQNMENLTNLDADYLGSFRTKEKPLEINPMFEVQNKLSMRTPQGRARLQEMERNLVRNLPPEVPPPIIIKQGDNIVSQGGGDSGGRAAPAVGSATMGVDWLSLRLMAGNQPITR